MDLDIIRVEYLQYSKHFKSSASYSFDKSHLNIIIDFMIDNGITDSDQLDYNSIYDFIDYSKLRENTNNTINKRIALLKRSISFQIKQNQCEPTIIATFPKLRVQDKRFNVVHENTMKTVIGYLMMKDHKFINVRNRVIFFLFVDTGARLSEVSNIKTKNIDFTTNSILLEHTKAKRERVVYFSNFTANHLLEYIDLIDDSSEKLLRNSRNNNAMNYRGVMRVIDRIRSDLKLESLSSHMIRHSYGTLAYKKQISEFFTNHTMGHARMDMTRRYTHYDLETNKKIYDQLAPMEHYTKKNH